MDPGVAPLSPRVEAANRDGHFAKAQCLELVPVHLDGLTTADEQQMQKNEAQLNHPSWNSSGDGWGDSGKGQKPGNYPWVPKNKGKGKKGKDEGKKGDKGKGKGKKD